MIWYLVRFQQYAKVLWVTKTSLLNHWKTVRGNYILRDEDNIVLGIVVTNATNILPYHEGIF